MPTGFAADCFGACGGQQRARLTAAEARWAEFRSWIEANSDRPAHADPLLNRAYALAVEAGDRHLAAYVLTRKRPTSMRRRRCGTGRVRAYEEVLPDWPRDGRLDEGTWRAGLALAYLDEGESQRAAEVGLSPVRVATATSSVRTLRAVGRVVPRLRRNRDLPAVPEFTDAYRAALGVVTMNP